MAWMICELKNPGLGPATFSTARLAPGAMPLILMLQPGGSGWAGLTKPDRSYVWLPCEAIDPASRKDSRPSVGAPGPKPLKSWKSKITCWPFARIRSGLFGSMPSAMIPTLIPVPSAIRWAASTFITVRASGSMIGWAGVDGQICCGAAAGLAAAGLAPLCGAARAGTAAPGLSPSGANRRMVSGTTALIAGLARSLVISAVEIGADIALMIWKPSTFVVCSWASSDRTPAWALLAALIRSGAVAPLAGRLVSWFLKMMIERCVALAESWLTCAAERMDG